MNPRLVLGPAAGLAALYLACVLPGEPSSAERIRFTLDFPVPYRVPLAGAARPPVKITADGQVLSGANYRLESLNPGMLRVDPAGRSLVGVARGMASVRVIYETATGAPDTTFPVRVVVSRVAVSSASVTITRLADTSRLTATAYDAKDAAVAGVKFTWSSAEPRVASVDTAGLVRALNEGTVTITAEADSVTGPSQVSVTQVAAVVRMVLKLDTLHTVGRSAQFLALAFDDTNGVLRTAKPHWSSSNESVARVDTAGLVTATGAGTAKIIARVGSAADTATMVVAQVVRFLIVKPGFDTLTAIADTVRYRALAFDSLNFPIPKPSVVWATGDPAVVTVDPAGLVRAAKNGVVLVTASAAGQSAFATVVVHQEVSVAQLSPHRVALANAGDTARLSAVGLDRNGYGVAGATFSWRTGSECVATVYAGLVTARGSGETAVITAPVNGGRSDTAAVNVTGVSASEGEIGFETDYAGGGVITVCADGSGGHQLIANTSSYSFMSPAWSPDGARIVFARREVITSPASCAGGMYVGRADGSELRAITSGCDDSPAWSPDGTRIAFTRWAFDNQGYEWGSLYVVKADGTDPRRLGGNTSQWWYHPTWSPDGTKIAFDYGTRRPGGQIAVVNADGTSFNSIYLGENPAWSPDGSTLAFESWDRSVSSLAVISPDGSGYRTLVAGWWIDTEDVFSWGKNFAPAWSPDGTQIVFGRTWHSCSCLGAFSNDLFVINRDGTELRSLLGGSLGSSVPSSPTWRRIPAPTSGLAPAAARTRLRSRP